MKNDNHWKQPLWRRFVFRRAMTLLSGALVLSAAAAGFCGDRVYFTFASCAAGVLLWAEAWREYCRLQDGKPLWKTGEKVPWILRGPGAKKRHKPAFLMDSRDFDDDLTPLTAVNGEGFSEREEGLAMVFSSVFSGALMILLSFLIR